MIKRTPVIDAIYNHSSVRHYRDEPIAPDLVRTIVAAGQQAATSSNLQLYSAIAVSNPASRKHLAELCGDQEHICQAPVFIAWCADLSRLHRICLEQGYQIDAEYIENFLVAAVDTALLMQNACLAAESLGLGTCFIGGIRNRPAQVIKALDLPKLTFAVSGMTLGYPDSAPVNRPRLETEAVLHWERYDPKDEAKLLDLYDASMRATGIYQGRQIDTDEDSDQYGWREHSARRVKKTSRTDLRVVLEHQGFGLK